MKIRTSLIILFSLVIIFTVGSISFLVFDVIITSSIHAEIKEMSYKLNERGVQLQTLHNRANEDLVFALKNPKFVEYFELSETREGNIFENDVLQFTNEQREIKQDLEQWVFHFQNKFQVDETCLIDATGQEHLRLVFQDIEVDEFLSPEEMGSLFFIPSFTQEQDDVYIQHPYFSPDSFRWVFAYTSPIVLHDGEKPAFYHFEMPVIVFQDIISIDHGRMYVVDPQGYLIADSAYSYPTTEISEEFEEYFPLSNSILSSSEFEKLQSQIKSKSSGNFQFLDEAGESQHIVFKKLSTFDWILVYQESEALILSEFQTELGSVFTTISLISILVTISSIVGIIIVSNKITKPIIELRNVTRKAKNGIFEEHIQIKGADELTELGQSFLEMFSSIKKTIELKKKLAISEEKVKNERYVAIGELSARMAHDIRNPLYSIKNSTQILNKRVSDKISKQAINIINRSIGRINHQLTQVLDFIRKTPPQIEQISFLFILREIIQCMNIPQNITIKQPVNDFGIFIDITKFENAIYNILFNAIQAINLDKRTISISITAVRDNIKINISNDGPPIPEDILPQIFEPLFTTKQKGTGLGLSSAKNSIEQHGGTISVTNNPVTFSINLPKIQTEYTKGV